MSGGLGGNVDSLSATPCGTLLVAGTSNFIGRHWTGTVAVLTADDAPRLLTQLELRAGVPAVAVLPQADEFTGRRVVASGSDDGSVDLWLLSGSAEAGAMLEHAQARVLHDAAVTSLAAAPGTGAQLASASADGTVRVWDCAQLLACTAQLGGGGGGGGGSINAVAWAGGADGDPAPLATAGQDGRLCLWDPRQAGSSTPAAAVVVGAPALSLAALAGPGGQPLLVAGDELGRVSVLDARALSAPLHQRALHADAVHALAAAPAGAGGSAVASGGDDGSILKLDPGRLEASRQLVPPQAQGGAPLYVRALVWAGASGGAWPLFRGGWDQKVVAVPC